MMPRGMENNITGFFFFNGVPPVLGSLSINF